MKIEVLDHGYVEFIEAWGTGKAGLFLDGEGIPYRRDTEVGIVEAARQSTQGSFRSWEQDVKLLKYLHEHKHATPFEFAGMVIEVQAPIFVFREWHRHRTQSYNEMSARYSPLPDLYYVPQLERLYQPAGTNKQAQGLDPNSELQRIIGKGWLDGLSEFYKQVEEIYQNSLDNNIPKELARLVMPVGHYTRMRASANLRNWLAFLTLRMDPAAQWEIRQFAGAVGELIKRTFPITWSLFNQEKDRENQN